MKDKMNLFSFDNAAQRVLYRYAFCFADFVPIKSDMVSVETQQKFYELCKSMVNDIAADPSLLGLPTDHPDEYLYANEVMNRHPELSKVRINCQNIFKNFAYFLYSIGFNGSCNDEIIIVSKINISKINKKLLAVFLQFLERYGFAVIDVGESLSFTYPEYPEILLAWHLLAAECAKYPDQQAVRFALFNHNNYGKYFLERLKTLLGLDDGFFSYVHEVYNKKGYKVEYIVDDFRVKFIYSKDVGGLSIEFATLLPTIRFVNMSSIGIKAILENANELNEEIRTQLVKFCKRCNDCMGCTKSGKNKQFTVTILFGGNEYRLCPEFVQMEWYNNDISTEKIDFMLELNELQEKYGKNWKNKNNVQLVL